MAAGDEIPAMMTVPRFVGEGAIDWVDGAPVPEPGPGELLVRVHANAICGTDRLPYQFGSPVTPGHEAAGAVAAAGPGTSTRVGTRGAVFLMDFCGACRSCRLGHTNQCLAKRGDLGFDRDGGFAPFELVHESVFFPVGEELSYVEATLLLDVMGTSGHAIARARAVRPDIESVLIAGAGPIGLGLVAMARIVLGEQVPVVVFDRAPFRLKLAETLGAVAVNIADEQVTDALDALSLDAVDVAFDASGKAKARRACLDLLAKRGVLVCIGHGQGIELDVSPDLIAPERSVLGSEYFRFDEMGANLVLLREHRAYLDHIITHRFPVAELPDAFEAFLGGETGKVVVEQ